MVDAYNNNDEYKKISHALMYLTLFLFLFAFYVLYLPIIIKIVDLKWFNNFIRNFYKNDVVLFL